MGFDIEGWLRIWRVPLPEHRDLSTRISLAREDTCDDYEALAAGASPALLSRLLDDASAAVVASLPHDIRTEVTGPGPLLDALEAAILKTVALGLQLSGACNGRQRWTAMLISAKEHAGAEPPDAVVVDLDARRG